MKTTNRPLPSPFYPITFEEIIRSILTPVRKAYDPQHPADLATLPPDPNRDPQKHCRFVVRGGIDTPNINTELLYLVGIHGRSPGNAIQWWMEPITKMTVQTPGGPEEFQHLLIAEAAPTANLETALAQQRIILEDIALGSEIHNRTF